MKRLYSHQSPVLLEQLAQELAGVGIECMLRNMSMTGQAAGELPPIVCWPEIWVRHDSDLVPAQKVVERFLSALEYPGETWQCPRCGEQIEAQFGACWRCAGDDPA